MLETSVAPPTQSDPAVRPRPDHPATPRLVEAALHPGWWLGLPGGLFALFVVLMVVLPTDSRRWLYAESGPLEWAQVLFFLAAAVLAIHLAFRAGGAWWARACYLGFGLVGLMVVGEELSWGQHMLGFETPEALATANKQDEANLHNLFDDLPSRLMRRFLEIGLPILCIAMPLVLLLTRTGYRPGDWTWRLLPRLEAAPALLLAALGRPLKKSDAWGVHADWSESASEYAELFWSLAILLWILTLSRRVLATDEVSDGRA